MKNVVNKYLKRILFYLIPFILISNQKYSTCDENFSFSDYPDFDEELDKICQQKKYLCIMIDAIKYSFKIINSFSQTHEENTFYKLSYQNTKSSSIFCQNISVENNEESKYIFLFSNCSSNMTGILLINETKKENNFYTKLYLNKIKIFMNKVALKGEMHISFEYYITLNKNFSYEYEDGDKNFILKMDKIMENVFKNYTYQLKNIIELNDDQLLSQLKYFSDISNQFAKKYSFISKQNESNENQITYIAYNDFKYNSLINIYDYIYFPNLVVFFEYALNYNITYNEGNLTFDYLNFSKSQKEIYVGNIINKSAEFEEKIPSEGSNEIWEVIKEDFKAKFLEYK